MVATFSASITPEYLVEDQPREGRGPDFEREDEAIRPRSNSSGEGMWNMGCRLRFPEEFADSGGFRGRTKRESPGSRILRNAGWRESLCDSVSHPDGEEGRDPSPQDHRIHRHAETARAHS